MASGHHNSDEVLAAAAQLWDELRLPPFLVDGYLDGRYRQYTVSEVLRVAAERLREQRARVAASSIGVAA